MLIKFDSAQFHQQCLIEEPNVVVVFKEGDVRHRPRSGNRSVIMDPAS